MTHLDPSSLAKYNSLIDPHLQSYFSNERIRSHLKHAGLISGQGEIVPDSEYRTRLVRREHRKHVRHMLAENIVNRAIDMERTRQAEVKRQFEIVAKAALVNNIKESRKRNGNLSGLITNSFDMGLITIDSSWQQKNANQQNEISNEQTHIPRIQSANVKHLSKTSNHHHRRRSLQRPKSSNINRSSSSIAQQRPRSPTKSFDSSPCEITMVYYGPHTKVDYDHLVFEPIDEIIVMQQHCGGENLIVYKDYLKPEDEFTFTSHRHSDYPFGLSLYVKGLIDSRISTCCEYKHRHGVKLGGDRGHFAIKSVQGSKPCIKCLFEKQARLKKYAQSPKDKNNENNKSIIVSIPVSDQLKINEIPVKIPVRRNTSISNETYSEDFQESDKQKENYSTDTSTKHSHTKKKQSKSKIVQRSLPINPKESSRRSSSTEDITPRKESIGKTWQMKFYPSNISNERNISLKKILLKFLFSSNNEQQQIETHDIDMKQFTNDSQSSRQYLFPIKLKNIEKPEQIRLQIQTTENDDDDDEDIKWHLDHIELIDPQTQSHLIFPCKQWIRPSQETILQCSQDSSQNERKRKTSTSTNSSRSSSPNDKLHQQSSKIEQKPRISSPSSASSNISKKSETKLKLSDRISSDNQNEEITPRNDIDNQENKIHHQIEKTFEIQSKQSDNESTPRNISPKSSEKQENNIKKERSPSFQSMSDDDAHYKKIFQKLDPDNQLRLGSQPPSPSIRHEQQNTILPLTTTENGQHQFKTWYQINDDDED